MTDVRLFHDAGHGGRNSGIVHGGIVEKAWTLWIAEFLASHMTGVNVEHSVSRRSDIPLALHERSKMAREFGASLAFAHHVNGGFFDAEIVGYDYSDLDEDDNPEPIYAEQKPNPALHGLMCFARNDDPLGLEVGSAIMRAAPSGLVRRSPVCYTASPVGWTRRTFNVLESYDDIPAVLSEWFFATAPRDAQVARAEVSRPALVTAAQAGIARLFELT